MRIDLVFPTLPPTIDGIGDHTARLARTLADQGWAPRVLTAQRDWTPLSGVSIRHAFHCERRRGILDLVSTVEANPPDWLLLQFEQFSFGRWGLNPFLPLALRRLRQKAPDTQIAVLFHEDYMPAAGVRSAIISLWQRPQFWGLACQADVALFSTEPRTRTYQSQFSSTAIHHLPVASNIPKVEADPDVVQAQLGMSEDDFVIGIFGSDHPSRLLSHARPAIAACAQEVDSCCVLYVGPDGPSVRTAIQPEVPFHDAGALSPDEVSRCFGVMDLYLAPFRDGVSTRRGSFLTGLQHGVATATPRGDETGSFLSSQHGEAFVAPPRRQRSEFVAHVRRLARRPGERQALGQDGQALYDEHFSWPTIAAQLRQILTDSQHEAGVPPALASVSSSEG